MRVCRLHVRVWDFIRCIHGPTVSITYPVPRSQNAKLSAKRPTLKRLSSPKDTPNQIVTHLLSDESSIKFVRGWYVAGALACVDMG